MTKNMQESVLHHRVLRHQAPQHIDGIGPKGARMIGQLLAQTAGRTGPRLPRLHHRDIVVVSERLRPAPDQIEIPQPEFGRHAIAGVEFLARRVQQYDLCTVARTGQRNSRQTAGA